jgi:hypothetical protein
MPAPHFKSWAFWSRTLVVLQTFAVIAGVWLIYLGWNTLQHQKEIDSANLVLRFDDYFDRAKFAPLIDTLDTDDPKTPILKDEFHKGSFSASLIYDYLNIYETLDDLCQHGLISGEMVFQNFSYDLEKAYANKDIQDLIRRDAGNDPLDSWVGFNDLGRNFGLHKKNTCPTSDKNSEAR